MTNMDNFDENNADRAATDAAPTDGDVQGFGGAAGGVVLRAGGPAAARSVQLFPGLPAQSSVASGEESSSFPLPSPTETFTAR